MSVDRENKVGNPQMEVFCVVPAIVAHWELMHRTTSNCLKLHTAPRPHTECVSPEPLLLCLTFISHSLTHTLIHTASPVRFILTWQKTHFKCVRVCACAYVCAEGSQPTYCCILLLGSKQLLFVVVSFTRDTLCVCVRARVCVFSAV